MTPEKGVNIEALKKDTVGMTPMFDDEVQSPSATDILDYTNTTQELDFYIDSFRRNGLEGACNWYRTRRINFNDDQKMPEEQRRTIKQPVLFIQATLDDVLIPAMSKDMETYIPDLTRAEVPSSHWALWHTPVETNEAIRLWFKKVGL